MTTSTLIFIVAVLSLNSIVSAVTNLKAGLVCENEYLELKCKDGGVINILDANYGRTSTSVCYRENTAKNTTCYSEISHAILEESCEGEQQCKIQASNRIFNDPCHGTTKYLSVLYKCLAFREFKKALACEHKDIKLKCEKGQVIRVLSANYGRKSRFTCTDNPSSTTNCQSVNSFKIVSEKCDDQRKCKFEASNDIFGDPCSGTYKYLSVKYKCVNSLDSDDTRVSSVEFRCNDGTVIPESKMCNGFKDCPNGDDEVHCDYNSKFACEGKKLKIKCNEDEKIRIINANFGRLSKTICPKEKKMRNLNCRSNSALEVIQKKCEKKEKCEIKSSVDNFGNPCSNTFKYTEVYYECEKPANALHSIDIRSV